MNLANISELLGNTKLLFWPLILLFSLLYIVVILRHMNLRYLKMNFDEIFSSYSRKELWISFFLQLIIAIIISTNFTFKIESINVLLTMASIFCGLLFNLLVLVYDLFQKLQEKIERDVLENGDVTSLDLENSREALLDLYRNIGLLIFESISMIVISLPFVLGLSNKLLSSVLTFVLIYLLLCFIKQLFITLKKVFVLMISSIE